jgi:predicted ferric reductase
MTPVPASQARAVPLPRQWGLRALDVVALVAGNAVLIVLMWVRHGGLDQLGTLAGALTAGGQLAALLGTYLALVGIVLMARSPWLDQAIGPDRLASAHRWIGFATIWLIAGHAVMTILGWALGDGRNVVAETIDLAAGYPYVLWAVVGFGLFVMVGVTSMAASRRRLSYETWYWLHVYTYLAIALAFLHQLFVGTDFTHDPLAAVYWISLYVATASLVAAFRFGQPVLLFARHGFRVGGIVEEAPGVASLYVTGRDLDRLPMRSGQYFVVRLLRREDWWRAHPYSISSAPNGTWIRFTVKALGDDSATLPHVEPGTRVLLEGPYGVLTGAVRTRRKVTLIAGGIGISPLRALLESLAGAPGDLTLLYRAASERELVFRDELDRLAAHRGATVHYLVGRRGVDLPADPLNAATLARLVPDIADQDVYLCGPTGLMRRTEASLLELGVPRGQVHAERFSY